MVVRRGPSVQRERVGSERRELRPRELYHDGFVQVCDRWLSSQCTSSQYWRRAWRELAWNDLAPEVEACNQKCAEGDRVGEFCPTQPT